MFWKRQRKPAYKRVWEEWKNLLLSLSTVVGAAVSLYAYVAVDTAPFIATTEIVAAADRNNLYVLINTISELDEQSYIIVNLDGQQVRSLAYPKGIPEGNIIMEIPIPFTSDGDHLDVNVEIVIVGPRTLFMPETLEVSIDVEKHSGNTTGIIYTSSSI